MGEIYNGRGNEAFYDEYIDCINYVFGFNGNVKDLSVDDILVGFNAVVSETLRCIRMRAPRDI